mmetsp:Transcript_37938/g.64820  ORF Transcript_37938/g.64820 Transcript_37938/m.64820 type:complete len:217 (-) Transcript_37938:373-1023(-)
MNTLPFLAAVDAKFNFFAASFHEEGTSIEAISFAHAGATTTTSSANFSNGSNTERTISSSLTPSSATSIVVEAYSPKALPNRSQIGWLGAKIPTRGRIMNSGVMPVYDSESGRSYQNPAPGVANGVYAPQSVMVTGTEGSPPPSGSANASTAVITSIPETTSPNTTCFPSHCGALSSVTKNWDVLEFFPLFPMESIPARSCLSPSPARSSLNFLPL